MNGNKISTGGASAGGNAQGGVNNKKVFVGGIAWATTDDGLLAAFSQFGNVVSAKIITDRDTGKSKGFGFVEMETEEEAENAVKGLNGGKLDGRTITVNIAKPLENKPNFRRNNNRR